ncbi:MAG: FecCD family ABC transporter permease [Ilumatobacteraceae bacterium]
MTPAVATVRPRSGSAWWMVAAVALLVVAVILGVMVGPAGTVSSANWEIVRTIRLPRVILAGIVGAMLSVAGASYQGVFRNPLVDPYLLGAAAGAGLGATLVFTYGRGATVHWPVDPLPLAAFAGALIAVLITYAIGASFGGTGLTLVLAGVAVASLGSAVQQFLLLRNSDVIKEVYGWISGRVSSATWGDIRLVLPYVVVSCAVLLAHRRHLDVLRVGDDEASTLGAEVKRIRLIIVIAASLGTAAVVSVSGLIGFVGIMVPHLVRFAVSASYRWLLPLTIVVGAAFLILVDIPGRMIDHGGETPLGVVTALIGAPMFVVVLRSRRRLA